MICGINWSIKRKGPPRYETLEGTFRGDACIVSTILYDVNMKLLITTQTVDLDNPALGFFHGWILEFAKHCEQVTVICLKEGRHELPTNVRVLSLGKEVRRSRFSYVWRFYHYIYAYRHEYDAVFVHMNPEYAVLGGPFWRQWKKRVALWRNHYQPSILADIAAIFSHVMFSTSKKSYIVKYRKTVLMPIGIDTKVFKPLAEISDPHAILFFGRLDASKRGDVFLQALEKLHRDGVDFRATIAGDPTDPDSQFATDLRSQAQSLVRAGLVSLRGSVPNREAPKLYQQHAIYCNLSPDGMFDKTIGEAAACGCVLVVSNDALSNLTPAPLYVSDGSAKHVASALKVALELSDNDRRALSSDNRSWVVDEHGLSALIPRVLAALEDML